MMNKIKEWWGKTTLNEKLMYALILMLIVGILTRWNYVFGEIGEAFSGLFPSIDEQVK